MLFSNNPRLRALLQKSPRWVVGVAVATPAVALLQGVSLLLHYRENFHDSPYPITPSQGVVVSNKASLFASIDDDEQPPLRILVIGDSLAAGVGVMHSATPVLPESMAKVLSHKLGGRPVYWTCIGQPGASLPEIINQIQANHETLVVRQDSTSNIVPRKSIVQQRVEEHADQFIERRKRLRYWWEHQRQVFRQQPSNEQSSNEQSSDESSAIVESSNDSETVHDPQQQQSPSEPISINTPSQQPTLGSDSDTESSSASSSNNSHRPLGQLWDNLKSDWRSLQQAWQGPTPDELLAQQEQRQKDRQAAQQQAMDPFTLWQKWKRRLIRQESSLSEPIGQYDIAVVMTGANDLKQAWLPFMFTNNNTSKNNDNRNNNADSNNDADTSNRFLHVLKALKSKMELVLDQQGQKQQKQYKLPEMSDHDEHTAMVEYHDTSSENNNIHHSPRRHPPLVVFPAMPVTMVPDFHKPPMSWFIFWMFQRLEDYKRAIAQQFPGEVVFVEAPPPEIFVSKDGRAVQEPTRPAEEVLLAITNVRERVKQRMNQTLEDYRRKWAELMTEDQEIEEQQNGTAMADEGENNDGDFGHHPDESYVDYEHRRGGHLERTKSNHSKRSPVLSIDQLHPNDRGYEIWGQHIAEHVLEKWNAERS